jgi:acyl carrier protein
MSVMDLTIENILVDFLKEHCLPQRTKYHLKHEDNLFNTGVLDSAGLLHFVGYIEQNFNFSIPDEDLIPENFLSIASIANYIRSRIREPVIID